MSDPTWQDHEGADLTSVRLYNTKVDMNGAVALAESFGALVE